MKKLIAMLPLLLLLFATTQANAQTAEIEALLVKAEQGDAAAQNNLGNMYFSGTGIPQNYSEAVKWYRLAAEEGWGNGAQFRLGYMYANGFGVAQDISKAYAWFSVAAAQGDTTAADRRDRFGAQLSPQALEQAQALATKCFDSNFKDCN